MVWIGSIVLSITGLDLEVIGYLQNYWGLLAVVLTAIAYPLGILVDTLADLLLEKKNLQIRTEKVNVPEEVSLIQLLHQLEGCTITNYFTYNRFKARVTRSSSFIFLLIGLYVPLFLWLRGGGLGIEEVGLLAITFLLTFVLLSISKLFMWMEVVKTIH